MFADKIKMDHRKRITLTLVSVLCITGSLAVEQVSIFSTSNLQFFKETDSHRTNFTIPRTVFASTEKQSTLSTTTTTTTTTAAYPPSPSLIASTTVQQSTTQHQNTTTLPGTTLDSLPISLYPSQPSTVSLSTAPQSSDIVEAETTPDLHTIIGSAGPDKKESEGIQRALDWLKEKRSSDYGWENDTHMVILAKEVSRHS